MNHPQCGGGSESLPVLALGRPLSVILQEVSVLSSSLSNGVSHEGSAVVDAEFGVSGSLDLAQGEGVCAFVVFEEVELHLSLVFSREQLN